MLVYVQYRGLKLSLRFESFEMLSNDYLTARFLLYEGVGEDPRPKTFRLQKDEDNLWSCLIDDAELDRILKQRMAV